MQKQTISQLVGNVKNRLEGEFSSVYLEGEISNLTRSGNGHWYFTLSDNKSSISAVMFRMDAARNPEIKRIQNGDKVDLYGGLGVYAPRGTFQVIGKRIIKQGQGDLKEQFEKLKAKLAAEGLFDLERKKMVPPFARKIAVVTSATGAAIHDFLKTIKSTPFAGQITCVPAVVQGEKAVASIVEAISKCEKTGYDLIVLTRGGGSIEDLWCFNSEVLVRKIAKCPLPIISAVGHQTDYTLSDYVSDQRCATPTAAAGFIAQAWSEIDSKLKQMQKSLEYSVQRVLKDREYRLKEKRPGHLSHLLNRQVSLFKNRLDRLNLYERSDHYLDMTAKRLKFDEFFERLSRVSGELASDRLSRVELLNAKLTVLSPYQSLERGFSYIQVPGKKLIKDGKSFDHLENDTKLEIIFRDGARHVRKTD